ncbi:MAG: RNA-binding domain-containing protein [Candidatus Woesearchaeota archaeon]
MKLTNTILLRAHNKNRKEHARLKNHLKEVYKEQIDVQEETLSQEGFEDIHVLSAKLYRQPGQRLFLQNLNLLLTNKKALQEELPKHVDEKHDLYFRLEQESIYTQQWRFVHAGEVIQVRINLCAHPKTRENALRAAKQLFA